MYILNPPAAGISYPPLFYTPSAREWGVGLLQIRPPISLQFDSLAFVGGHISSQNKEIGPPRRCSCCAAIRIACLAFIRVTFVPRGIVELRHGLGELIAFR